MDTPYTIAKRALENGKPAVNANKALMAERGAELLALAAKMDKPLYTEAAVGGGIPILKTLRESLVANDITSLTAIINGTTNFILTKMGEERLSYFEALKLASDLGFAEADPTMDVEGIDAQQKLKILAAHISGGRYPDGEILCEGITGLTERDFVFAERHGFAIKLLALARKREGLLELRVHPTLIPVTHPLASVRNEFNAIYMVGDAVGQIMLSGKGAGSLPTASAVYADIVDIVTRSTVVLADADGKRVGEKVAILPPEEIESEYYLRFTIDDKPGVIGDIATALGNHGISVTSAAAELIPNVREVGEVDIFVHATKEKHIRAAMEDINNLDLVRSRGRYLRIERELD